MSNLAKCQNKAKCLGEWIKQAIQTEGTTEESPVTGGPSNAAHVPTSQHFLLKARTRLFAL